MCAQVCVCAFGPCCFVGANGCIPLTMLADMSVLLFAYVCMLTAFETMISLFKTWSIKKENLNLNLNYDLKVVKAHSGTV